MTQEAKQKDGSPASKEEIPIWRDSIDSSLCVSSPSSETTDTIETFLQSNNLYGREEEVFILKQAFRRCTAASRSASPEIVLLTGNSGTGKSRLANVLRQPVGSKSGYFLSGKFDQLERPEAFYPVVQALNRFVNDVLNGNEYEKKRVRSAIESIVNQEVILMDVIPALAHVLGPMEKKVIEIQGDGIQKQIILAICRLFAAVASPERPVVLFVDDLQWSEPSTLELLAALSMNNDIGGLMVLGACRGNEVPMDHALSVRLRELEAEGVLITNIPVTNLQERAVVDMLSDILSQPEDEIQHLASFIFHKTDGNTFFVLQLVRAMHQQGLLNFFSRKDRWKGNSAEEIEKKIDCDNISSLILQMIKLLPSEVQETLKVASCFGAEFDEYILSEATFLNTSSSLVIAEKKGFIVAFSQGLWVFTHDLVQHCAYTLLRDQEREKMHLDIGRRLLDRLESELFSPNLFLIANQLLHGAHTSCDIDERERFASFMLRAGENARKTSAFIPAAAYLNFAIGLLGKRHWRDQYALSLALFNVTAEIEYCTGNYDRVDALSSEVFLNARRQSDSIRVRTVSMYALGSRNRIFDAISMGYRILDDLGESFSLNFPVARILLGISKTNRLLNRLSDEDILNSSVCNDQNMVSTMRVLTSMLAYTMFAQRNAFPLIAMRMIELTLRHGLTKMACVAFATWGMLMSNPFHNVELGMRYARLGEALMERSCAHEWMGRCFPALVFTYSWKEPLRSLLKPLLVSHRQAIHAADIEFSMLCAAFYAGVALHVSLPLNQLLQDMFPFIRLAEMYKQSNMLQHLRYNAQYAMNLQGQCSDPTILTSELMDEDQYMHEAWLAKNTTAVSELMLAKLRLASYFQAHEKVELLAAKIFRMSYGGFAPFGKAALFFHAGLAAAAMCRVAKTRARTKMIKRCHRILKGYAAHGGSTFINKFHLLDAELDLLRGNVESALSKFSVSIQCAEDDERVNEAGLAYVRVANVLSDIGRHTDSVYYLEKATEAYERWEAWGLVDQIRNKQPVHIFP